MDIKTLKKQFEIELSSNILNYWVREVYDPERRTFYGRISNTGNKFREAPLSAVLLTRIMWTFSRACRFISKPEYKKMADEAFRILAETFWDHANGGIYWSVSPDGQALDTKKQFYAQAFFIYALSEYARAFSSRRAQQMAVSLFMLMEGYALDPKFGGYREAASADWKVAADQRLSARDQDAPKSMNTHLHILEAYTNLYRVHKTADVKKKLEQLIRIFLDKIPNKNTGHLMLFFDKDWTVQSQIDSYGHDIEATWLLCEAAEVLGKKEWISEVKHCIKKILDAAIAEGFAAHGGMYYEKNGEHLHEQFDWWPQAEAVVGFYNAWQVFGDEKYLDLMQRSWNFIQKNMIDHKNGEWFWGVGPDLKPVDTDKVNAWKGPYHNGRMCLEMMGRMG